MIDFLLWYGGPALSAIFVFILALLDHYERRFDKKLFKRFKFVLIILIFVGAFWSIVGSYVKDTSEEKNKVMIKNQQAEINKQQGELLKLQAKLNTGQTKVQTLQNDLVLKQRKVIQLQDKLTISHEKQIELSNEFRKYITGGDSYLYLHFREIDGSPIADLMINGNYPVHDPQLEIWNVNQSRELQGHGKNIIEIDKAALKIIPRGDLGPIYPNQFKHFLSFPFSTSDTESNLFYILISARNGEFQQTVAMKKINGAWVFAYRIYKILTIKGQTQVAIKIFDYTDPIFPKNKLGGIDELNDIERWATDYLKKIFLKS